MSQSDERGGGGGGIGPGAVLGRVYNRWGKNTDDVADLIIRPGRAEYEVSHLGPKMFHTSATGRANRQIFVRQDVQLENPRGMRLECSWYMPDHVANAGVKNGCPQLTPEQRLPVVVYMHGNCGCRLDGEEALFLLDEGITVFTLDCSGSGLSEGDWVSLGFWERQDLASVFDYLQTTKKVSQIGLWGRSMGAVSSVMYGCRDPSVACICADSPFSSLRLLVEDLVKTHAKGWVPKPFVNSALKRIKNNIQKRAQFDIDDLDCIKYARQCAVPAFIFHGEDDDFVKFRHSQLVAENYLGDCIHQLLPGGHNDSRKEIRDTIRQFFKLHLLIKPKQRKEEKAKAAAAAAAEKAVKAEGSAVATPTATLSSSQEKGEKNSNTDTGGAGASRNNSSSNNKENNNTNTNNNGKNTSSDGRTSTASSDSPPLYVKKPSSTSTTTTTSSTSSSSTSTNTKTTIVYSDPVAEAKRENKALKKDGGGGIFDDSNNTSKGGSFSSPPLVRSEHSTGSTPQLSPHQQEENNSNSNSNSNSNNNSSTTNNNINSRSNSNHGSKSVSRTNSFTVGGTTAASPSSSTTSTVKTIHTTKHEKTDGAFDAIFGNDFANNNNKYNTASKNNEGAITAVKEEEEKENKNEKKITTPPAAVSSPTGTFTGKSVSI